MKFRRLALAAATLALASATLVAHADPIAYIATWRGHMLHMSGSTAVTADWRGQTPISGFSGYGQVQMNGRCLTGRTARQPLTWDGCSNDRSQRWKLSGGRLNNELGFCADVERASTSSNARILAWECTGAPNQNFTANYLRPAHSVASRIGNPSVREKFLASARSAAPGSLISTSTGQVVSAGGANAVSAGGANVVSAGGGNVVSAGGLN